MPKRNKEQRRRESQSSQHSMFSLQTFILCMLSALVGVYVGLLLGTSSSDNAIRSKGKTSSDKDNQLCIDEAVVQERIKMELRRFSEKMLQKANNLHNNNKNNMDDTSPRFPESVKDLVVGAGLVPRDDFAARFLAGGGVGVPLDATSSSNSHVILLYHSQQALPDNAFLAQEVTSQTALPILDTALEATANCDYLNIALVDHSGGDKRRQCTALIGQYESFHLQKFMRLPTTTTGGGKLDSKLPLQLVPRGAQANGKQTKPPSKTMTLEYWNDVLKDYLSSLNSVLKDLKPIALAAASASSNQNTVIVLVCNFGQSELLMNFICSARARHLDLGSVLIFATDEETRDLVLAMNNNDNDTMNNVKVFYDEINYGKMPKEAARRYADQRFRRLMLAKVFCVQMVLMLGHNVLFQDVDVIYYKHPFDYFYKNNNNNQTLEFDMYFQDDGNHALYYAPYSANTGFYYVNNNAKTQHFFNTLLLQGDSILATKSHQAPLIALLSEHASLYGLRIKIFARTENDFVGGHAFHRRRDYMKDLMTTTTSSGDAGGGAAEYQPYIFHMSWTLSKDNKVKFFQQMGEWYWKEECTQKTVSEIVATNSNLPAAAAAAAATISISHCCAAEPIVVCHYRDKPSKISCRDSPPIDKGRPSFWK